MAALGRTAVLKASKRLACSASIRLRSILERVSASFSVLYSIIESRSHSKLGTDRREVCSVGNGHNAVGMIIADLRVGNRWNMSLVLTVDPLSSSYSSSPNPLPRS